MKSKTLIFILIILINFLFCNYSYGTELNATSPEVILFNTNSESIIYEKNAYKITYPASTTKIMTAILVLENGNLEDTTTVSSNATILPYGYVSAHLQVDEVLTIKDLLHLLLVTSANDAANVLAEYVAGSVSEFANMMNEKAVEIECTNTHFVNPNGVHDSNHYTTAYDLCLIANYAMKNETFREIVSTVSYTVPATNKYKERTFSNTNKLLQETNEDSDTQNIYYYEYATGIKTGYTEPAKNCLVASAKKDGVEYIAVILGSKTNEDDFNSERFADAKNLFITAFDNYTYTSVKHAGDIVTNVEIPNGNFIRKNLDLELQNDLEFLIKNEDLEKELIPEITIYDDALQAPISKGNILGTATYTYNNITSTINIVATNDVISAEQMNLYLSIIIVILLILVTLTIIEIIRKKRA